ncbi:hypothetical protein FF098_001270 [Parvularcula flava]|uniref:DUF4175 domain-containing protein n=1 Tax=Aquisalinus luteolus TaxID=1566827 RepID=A0A8J3A0B9_9PROT|nr:hypothetical protein [Aquisalinus luteolus]NHK26533.1 hypothetical protein [Aquisalinus luteolus]GGH92628.1 hypothetical protein GCM10011355_02570 [Aquisalinus luteolus]
MRKRLSLRAIFAIPLFIAVTSLIGLVTALVGNDLWDALSWLTLGLPVAITIWALMKRRV